MYISYLSVFLRKIDEIIELNIDFKKQPISLSDKVISLLDEMPTGKNIKAIPGNPRVNLKFVIFAFHITMIRKF